MDRRSLNLYVKGERALTLVRDFCGWMAAYPGLSDETEKVIWRAVTMKHYVRPAAGAAAWWALGVVSDKLLGLIF
jgi:hypothetical protein